jgi:hypothetical protein
MDELDILRFKIAEKYENEIHIYDVKRDENRIKIYFCPIFDEYNLEWDRIRQDISFIVKEIFGYHYTTIFKKQQMI